MEIYLGLSFEGSVLPTPAAATIGVAYFDYSSLLSYLEGFYALGDTGTNREALRTEQYRQVVEQLLQLSASGASDHQAFFAASYLADRIATAEDLLSRRDELIEIGYPLGQPAEERLPPRIATLHALEALLLDPDNELDLLPGRADRLNLLLAAISERRHPDLNITVYEPRELLPPGLRRLLAQLARVEDDITYHADFPAGDGGTDLARWKRYLTGEEKNERKELTGDGSLILLRAERETHLAAYLARMVRDNPRWRPSVFLPVRNQTLDNALRMEGLPSMGVAANSLARPALQVLKLVTAFLWEPIEVQRVMEFLSLLTKPLDRRLSRRLATHLADTPGLFGNRWTFTVEEAFREMAARNYPNKQLERAREEYNFWFVRRRYPRDGRVPKSEVRQIFVFLRRWALETIEDQADRESDGLAALAAQAQRAVELLDLLPEAELSHLEIERLVRSVYRPVPNSTFVPEQDALNYCCAPAAIARFRNSGQNALNRLVWWDFVTHENGYFFSRWYPEEIAYLEAAGLTPDGPERQNSLHNWQQLRPVLLCQHQLLLCLPRRIDGSEVEPHDLLGDLQAAFGGEGLARISVDIDRAGESTEPLGDLYCPTFDPVPLEPLARPIPHLEVADLTTATPRETESPTSLEALLYYPHQWVFRHQLQLRGTPILSIAGENRLRGNLSHLFIEELLRQVAADDRAYTKGDVVNWINANWQRLLRQQGAVLLEYGQEPERVQFIRTMIYSAWSLVDHIQRNQWQIQGLEQRITGEVAPLGGPALEGRADLVLERLHPSSGQTEVAIVDLKWRGKTVFRNLLRNAADVQLCLYAELLRQNGAKRVHTAFYVLRDAQLLSRNELAFANIETVVSETDHRQIQEETLSRIRATYLWRWEQFREGKVEIRCQETLPFLEDLYLDLPHDALLEMKEEEARFDDYRSLIGLVR